MVLIPDFLSVGLLYLLQFVFVKHQGQNPNPNDNLFPRYYRD